MGRARWGRPCTALALAVAVFALWSVTSVPGPGAAYGQPAGVACPLLAVGATGGAITNCDPCPVAVERVPATFAGTTSPGGASGPTGPSSQDCGGCGLVRSAVAGSSGPSGPTGATGATGPQVSSVCTVCLLYPTGASGPTGPTGVSGVSGPTYVTGPIGFSATASVTGASGASGTSGPSGGSGPTGPSGVSGPTGVSGPSGPTGFACAVPVSNVFASRTSATTTLTLNWVGAIAFSTGSGLPRGGLARALAPLRSTLRGADLTIGDLDGTLSVGGHSACVGRRSCQAFQAPPGYATGLRSTGFTVLNLANGHADDFGVRGRSQTIAALRRAHVSHDGLRGEITSLRVGGVGVAVVGFAPYVWANDLRQARRAETLVRRARRQAQIVIVVMNDDAGGATQPHVPHGGRDNPRAFAHAMIDAGASIVLGSGPQTLRGIERYRDHMVAYSLGDFAGWRDIPLGGRLSDSAILHVTLNAITGRVTSGRLIALRLTGNGLPRIDRSHRADRLVAALSRADFASHRYAIGATGGIRP